MRCIANHYSLIAIHCVNRRCAVSISICRRFGGYSAGRLVALAQFGKRFTDNDEFIINSGAQNIVAAQRLHGPPMGEAGHG